jgi:hypothetical protein
MPQTERPDTPELNVEPSQIAFGTFDPDIPLTEQPTFTLKISNKGGGVLKGRIILQVSWLIITSVEFECRSGETSEHLIRLGTGAPQSWNRQEYSFDNLITVDSNVGIRSIQGSYRIGLDGLEKRIKPGWGLVALAIPLIIVLTFLIWGDVFQTPATAPTLSTAADEIFTQGAETVFARMSRTIESEAQQSSITPVITLFSPQTLETRGLSTGTPEIIITFTPWPREQFPNPEEIIKDYYMEINHGRYEHSWPMLSKQFQEDCCSIGGNDPFLIYQNWWKYNVDRVEVVSAYLQEWDVNPAVVLVSLRFFYKNGDVEDAVYYYYLISDADRDTLLLDKVK